MRAKKQQQICLIWSKKSDPSGHSLHPGEIAHYLLLIIVVVNKGAAMAAWIENALLLHSNERHKHQICVLFPLHRRNLSILSVLQGK